jgi:hypothetical protein
MSQRAQGSALPSALAAVALTAVLAAALADVARTELLLARARRTAAQALAAADACLARVIAELPVGWDFGAALRGPDGIAGTGDDGVLAAPAGCAATARPAAGAAMPPTRLELTIDAQAASGRRRLQALVGRSREPGAPALLWLADATALAAPGGRTIALDGRDPRDPSARAWAAAAAPGDPDVLDAWLAAGAALAPGTATPIVAVPPPLAALAARAAAAAGAGGLVGTGTPSPAITFVAGDLSVAAPAAGAGVLVVDGVLEVAAPLDFSGVVVATRGVHVAAGASLTVRGALWLGASPGASPLLATGRVTVARDPGALATADALLALPRPATLLGVQDLG